MTTCRNDAMFLEKWVDYYSRAFGQENLFVILDGLDQNPTSNMKRVNFIRLPHQPLERVAAMRRRARVMSDFGRGLHRYFDIVIASDVDEFLVLDPNVGTNLADYLSQIKNRKSISGLGLDVGQNLDLETPIDHKRPYLSQRNYAHVSARYTKPNTSFNPVTWGSGMHRVKGQNFRIDPNLFLFHFGMVDYEAFERRLRDHDRLTSGWNSHLERRMRIYEIIRKNNAIAGDEYFERARKLESFFRPLYAINKPGMIKGQPVIKIPERFSQIV